MSSRDRFASVPLFSHVLELLVVSRTALRTADKTQAQEDCGKPWPVRRGNERLFLAGALKEQLEASGVHMCSEPLVFMRDQERLKDLSALGPPAESVL